MSRALTALRWLLARPKVLALAAALLAGLVALAALRGCGSPPPPRVEERTAVDGKLDATWGSSARVARKVERRRAPSVRERFDPSGRLVERLTLGETSLTATTDTDRQSAGEAHQTVKVVTEKVTIPAPRPRFALEARGAWGSLRPVPEHFGAEVQVRIAGPVWVGAGVEKTDRVRPTLSARVEF